MFTEIQSTNFTQMFCKLMLYSEVIFKSVIDPDDTCQGDLPVGVNGLYQVGTPGYSGFYFIHWSLCPQG